MARFKLTIALILISTSCVKQIVVDENEITDELIYLKDQVRPFSGKYTVLYYNTNKPRGTYICNKGKFAGKAAGYHKNGKKKWEGYYYNGFMEGEWQFWDEEGSLTCKVKFEKDSLINYSVN